ncbi:MAG: nucleotidyltransferase family protein [Candidatus Eremiobacteraeota bacterium]|nr:nucleotidyltransferase family protein [Candidatus Eremiobacteraeota bacterium]
MQIPAAIQGSWESQSLHSPLPMAMNDGALTLLCSLAADFLEGRPPRPPGGLSPEIPWERLSQRACDESLVPLLFHLAQEESFAATIPPVLLSAWKETYYGTARRNTLLLHEVKQIIAKSRGRTHEVLVIKGAFLIAALYRNSALRPMHDADLIVKREDHQELAGLLMEQGFSPCGTREEIVRHRRLGRSVFSKQAAGEELFLELHEGILWSASFIPGEMLWSAPEAFRLNDIEAFSLERHLHFLYLVAHWAHHLRERAPLIWLLDMALFLREMGLSWDVLTRLAESLKLTGALFHLIASLEDAFSVSVPEETKNRLRPGGLEGLLYRLALPHGSLLSLWLTNPLNYLLPPPGLLEERYPGSARSLFRKRLAFLEDTAERMYKIIIQKVRPRGEKKSSTADEEISLPGVEQKRGHRKR